MFRSPPLSESLKQARSFVVKGDKHHSFSCARIKITEIRICPKMLSGTVDSSKALSSKD